MSTRRAGPGRPKGRRTSELISLAAECPKALQQDDFCLVQPTPSTHAVLLESQSTGCSATEQQTVRQPLMLGMAGEAAATSTSPVEQEQQKRPASRSPSPGDEGAASSELSCSRQKASRPSSVASLLVTSTWRAWPGTSSQLCCLALCPWRPSTPAPSSKVR